jgi:hypothetical protein
MTAYLSRDGEWRVTRISIDTTGHGPRELLRIECRDLTKISLHTSKDGPGLRVGPLLGPGGWFQGPDVRMPAEVAQYVPLRELVPMEALWLRSGPTGWRSSPTECHNSTDHGPLHFYPRCHLGEALWVEYQGGVLTLRCAQDGRVIAHIAVAPAEAVVIAPQRGDTS